MAGILSGLISPALTRVAKARSAYLSGEREANEKGIATALAQLKAKRDAESQAITDALHQAQTKKALQLPSGAPVVTIGPDGKRVYTSRDEAIGKPAPEPAEPTNVIVGPSGERTYATRSASVGKEAPKPTPDRVLVPVQQSDGSVIYMERGEAAGHNAPTPGSTGGAAITKAIAANKTQLATIDDALAELDAHPDAVGLTRGVGEVVGSIPGIGGAMAAAQDAANQRLDPEGVKARASLSNIGSLIIHDRSGAAVTVSEFPRLKPFIPTVQDTPRAIRDKLAKLRQAIETETGFLSAGRDKPKSPAPSKLSDLRAAAEAQLKAQGLTPAQILQELGPPDGDE